MSTDKITHCLVGSANHLLVEEFVSKSYKQSFQVDIEDFFPQFLTFQNASSNTYKAVVGMNSATNQALFSEFYLNKSIEQELACIPQFQHSTSTSTLCENLIIRENTIIREN
ncbi:MAG: thermostable hemolysin, partial [Pseudomonadota bacterium]